MRTMNLYATPLEVTPVGALTSPWQRRDRGVVPAGVPVLAGLSLLALGILLR
jgi:hypothetical protein